jgi:hypothetical protein
VSMAPARRKLPPLSPIAVSNDARYPYEVELIGGPNRQAAWAQSVVPEMVRRHEHPGRIEIDDDGTCRGVDIVVHIYVLAEVVKRKGRLRYRYLYDGIEK